MNHIEIEISEDRMIMISLQIAPQQWHMYVIINKRKTDGNYELVTSVPDMNESWIEVKDLECRLPSMTGVG